MLLVTVTLNNLLVFSVSVEKTFFYVLSCKDHPFGTKFVARREFIFDIEEKCACKDGLSHEVGVFCFSVSYLLNFNCYKVCVEVVPDYFVERVVPLYTYIYILI